MYQQLIDAGFTINAHVVTDHYWQDMGHPQRYRQVVVDAMAPDVFHSVFGGRRPSVVDCHPLCGDGSDRAWFRLSDGLHQLILADHGITPTLLGSEWNAFTHIGRHLFLSGLPVPQVYAHDAFSGLVFLEDLGDRHLQQAVNQASGRDAIEAIYRPVIDIWMDLTRKAAGAFDPSWTCQSPAYDAALILEKECHYFVEAFLNGYLGLGVDYTDLEGEFSRLARATMDNAIDGLIHRDFQSRNIMLRNDQPFLIDFQGAAAGRSSTTWHRC
ncbi:phosphotransferase [Desulfosarcina cetonica]|uniref:phosphotransferase n=1 Tax=Desulfosarcina cetonica TaxID=90730 RepID=UPI0006D28F8D|nr:phosphotransferase [Desulfosarcina cetonica]